MATGEASIVEQAPGLVRRLNLAVVRDYGVVLAFFALFITLSLSSNVFFTWEIGRAHV